MAGLLVKLYDLPQAAQGIEKLRLDGVEIRRAIGPEKHAIVEWAEKEFSSSRASECDVALSAQPVTCWTAR